MHGKSQVISIFLRNQVNVQNNRYNDHQLDSSEGTPVDICKGISSIKNEDGVIHPNNSKGYMWRTIEKQFSFQKFLSIIAKTQGNCCQNMSLISVPGLPKIDMSFMNIPEVLCYRRFCFGTFFRVHGMRVSVTSCNFQLSRFTSHVLHVISGTRTRFFVVKLI